MASQGHGSIINTSSVAFLGDYGGTGYPAGKGAVNGLTMAIAAELKAHGVPPTWCVQARGLGCPRASSTKCTSRTCTAAGC